MGWWSAGVDGSSLHLEDTGLLWGDGPADIMDDAIALIVAEFWRVLERPPTKDEMESGFKFSIGIYPEDGVEK